MKVIDAIRWFKAIKRITAGENVKPLMEDHAGSGNFRSGTGTTRWWKGDQCADSAFWIHA